MSSLFHLPFNPALNLVGAIAGAATLTFYESGTTTLATVFDADGDALPNPLAADIFGRFEPIYLNDAISYRVVLKTAAGVVLGDIDPYGAGADSAAAFRHGMVISGKIGSGFRPDGQLQILNDPTDPGHTIISLIQQIAGEEAAIESVGVLDNGQAQQQSAMFWRWLNGNNAAGSYEALFAIHLTAFGKDNTPLEMWARNSVRVCRGPTDLETWQDPPPENWFEVYTEAHVGTGVAIGPSMISTATPLFAGFPGSGATTMRLVVENRAFVGNIVGGFIDDGLFMGAAASGGFIQGYDGAAAAPLSLEGSIVRIGSTGGGNKVGFYGSDGTVKPTITGSRGGNAALASLLTALAAQNQLTDSTSA